MHLENDAYRLEINADNGSIVSFCDKKGVGEVIAEPRLADSFRLLLPLPGHHSNYVVGNEQRVTSIKKTAGQVAIQWDGPLANARGTYDVPVAMAIALEDDGVTFRFEADNRTEFDVAEVWYPMLGGLTGFGSEEIRRDTRLAVGFDPLLDIDLFRRFGAPNELGTPLPEWLLTYPAPMAMPWCDFYNGHLDRGLYIASHDPVARFKGIRMALHPGLGRGRREDDWPRPDEVPEDTPIGVTANWFHFPYTPPGERFEGPPVVVRRHQGDWREAARLYRTWFTSQFPVVDPRTSWMRRDMTAFQNTMFLLPEDTVNLTFKEIPRWAEDALEHGVPHVLISGWQVGGHDRGYPQYEPDPRLGTWEELETAVRACHEMGVRVFFFVNIHVVDMTTDAYRDELHHYTVRNHEDVPCQAVGWGMGTLGARLGQTHAMLARVSAGLPEVREIFVRQVRKLAEIGVDGIHIDKCHPVPLDFNPRRDGSPDSSPWEGTLRCVDETLDACRAINPEFALSVESNWDRMLSYTDVVWWAALGQRSSVKDTFPQWTPTGAVNQPFSYNAVNLLVWQGCAMLVGPGHYTASMNDALWRPLSAYIKEVQRIRQCLKDTLFLGQLLEMQATAVHGPFAEHEDARWSTFRNNETGKRACVLVNLSDELLEADSVVLADNTDGAVTVCQPFEQDQTAQLPVTITVPPERLVVLAEM